MATSGTVGRTVIDVSAIIEHAVRRCGVLTSVITSEQQLSARENLYLILTNFANKGLSLWCIQKIVQTLQAGRVVYNLPVGTIDLLNTLLRQQVTQYPDTALGASSVTVDLGSALQIESVAVDAAAAGLYEMVFEASDDGLAWETVGLANVEMATGDRVCLDSDLVISRRYWRVTDSAAAPKAFADGIFYSVSNELYVSKINRDDYTQLPNKKFTTNTPLQLWYDKQAVQPRVWMWPVPEINDQQIVFWVQREIEDPGAFSNTLAVPSRWLDAVIFELSTRVVLELPKELVPPNRSQELQERAATALQEAEDGERDGAPIRWAPDISPYTR